MSKAPHEAPSDAGRQADTTEPTNPNGADEAGTWRILRPGEVLPPGRRVRMNLGEDGHSEVWEPLADDEASAPAPTNGAGIPEAAAELIALIDQLAAIDDDTEFEQALLKNAALIKGSRSVIRRERAARRKAAKAVDLVAVREAVERLRGLPPDECGFELIAEAKRLNISPTRLGDLVKNAREADAEARRLARKRERERERELGLGDPLPPGVFTPKDALKFFNARYMVTCDGGRVFVCEPRDDPDLHRRYFVSIRPTEFRVLYANRRVFMGSDDDGNPVYQDAADFWFKHNERRQYIGGLVFRPNGHVAPDQYNLWQGFGVEPRPGTWAKFREHLLNVLCGGSQDHLSYLLGWMARAVQHPDLTGEVCVVIIGEEGAGKSTIGEIFGRLFGQHALSVSDARHLVGNFNFHLRDLILLLPEEVFNAGDKAAAASLRNLITNPTLPIEGKGQNIIVVRNCLHIMMTANPGWVVPAGLAARRFFVLNASATHVGDYEYFRAIRGEMEAGGFAALLHDLLNLDISSFNVRDVPSTDALNEQKKRSLKPHEAWWSDVLQRGFVFDSKLGLGGHFTKWIDPISMDLLYKSYEEYARSRHERQPQSREALGTFLTTLGGKGTRRRTLVIGEHITDQDQPGVRKAELLFPADRATGYEFGDLQKARENFVQKTGLLVNWPSDEEEI